MQLLMKMELNKNCLICGETYEVQQVNARVLESLGDGAVSHGYCDDCVFTLDMCYDICAGSTACLSCPDSAHCQIINIRKEVK